MIAATHETVDRSGWSAGPWDGEPDRAEWRTAAGLTALAVRVAHRGAWCGYVAVPSGHPCHGEGYDADATADISVHGGLNYADKCSGEVCHVPSRASLTTCGGSGSTRSTVATSRQGWRSAWGAASTARSTTYAASASRWRRSSPMQLSARDLVTRLCALKEEGVSS